MDEIKIPKATARRLPLYYRYLIFLNDEGKEKVVELHVKSIIDYLSDKDKTY